MILSKSTGMCRNVGFVSTRFNGTDGVSLETNKWVEVLERMGYESFYFSGNSDKPAKCSRVVPEAFFHHDEIKVIDDVAFNSSEEATDYQTGPTQQGSELLPCRASSFPARPPAITKKIHEIKNHLKEHIYSFIHDFQIDLMIVENALAIPMNIPLGIALTEFIAEAGFPTIAHHHDFFWERKRFLVNCVWDYLNMSFPPHLPAIKHVVINSSGANQLSLRTGISSMLIPNVMDFGNPPGPPDEYTRDIRADLGVGPDEFFILQPTRVVQRKGIEDAIELLSHLGLDARLVISHCSGDEGNEYEQRVRRFADMLGVPTNFVSDVIQTDRGYTEDGRKTYTIGDVYPHADLVTYPSTIEGFGNAFLEAVYYRKPVVVNNYTIFSTDIKPKGFRVIEFDGYITEKTVQRTRQVLENPEIGREMAEHNYRLAKRYYSYQGLERYLRILLVECFGENSINNLH